MSLKTATAQKSVMTTNAVTAMSIARAIKSRFLALSSFALKLPLTHLFVPVQWSGIRSYTFSIPRLGDWYAGPQPLQAAHCPPPIAFTTARAPTALAAGDGLARRPISGPLTA